MTEIVLFGGTTEGRELAALLQIKGIPTLVCVATEHGQSLLEAGGTLRVHTGRLDTLSMAALLLSEKPSLVIDATHPYATEVSVNIKNACIATFTAYIRVHREPSPEKGCAEFEDMLSLAAWLNHQKGIIFSTLGAKEAAALCKVRDFKNRIWLRILPSMEGLADCLSAGFPANHIICMQGPFSRELNVGMFKETGALILVTKESGSAGGFPEKLAAARNCGMAVAVLKRPRNENGFTLEELKARIEDKRL